MGVVNAENTKDTENTEKSENSDNGKNSEKSEKSKISGNSEKTDNNENTRITKTTETPKLPDNMKNSTPAPTTTTSTTNLGPYIGADILLDNSTITEQFFCVGLRESIHQRKISPEIMIDPADIMRCSLVSSVLAMVLVGFALSACCIYSTLTKVNAEGLTKQVYSTGRL